MSLGAFRENMMDVTMPFALMQARVTADDVARVHLKMNDELLGIKSGNYESLLERGSALSRSIHQANIRMNEKSRKSMEDFLFLTLNNRLAELDNIIAGAQARFAEYEAELIAEFGEDYLRINAEKFLDEETLASIDALPEDERDAAMWEALYKLSHENGRLKPGYEAFPIFKAAREKRIEALAKEERLQKREAEAEYQQTGDVQKFEEATLARDPELETIRNSGYVQNGMKVDFTASAQGTSTIYAGMVAERTENVDLEAEAEAELNKLDGIFDF